MRRLQEHARPSELATDVVQRAFVERTLQVAIQAALDAASVIVSARRLGEPENDRALLELLAEDGWVPRESLERLRAMVGFRNVIVHMYGDIDASMVRAVVENELGDLLDFAERARERLASRDPAD